MPILFGHPARDGDTVSPQLESLGIRKLRAKPSDVVTLGFPIAKQIHYATFSVNLPAFMHATEVQKKVDITQFYHPVKCDKDRIFPLPLPNLSVNFPLSLASQLREKFQQFGFSESTYKGEKIMVFQNPSPELVTEILGCNPNLTCAAPIETVNGNCLPILVLLRKMLSSFLSTLHYPAFQSQEHYEAVQKMTVDDKPIDQVMEDVSEKKKKRKVVSVDKGKGRKKRKVQKPEGDDEEMVDTQEEDGEEEEYEEVIGKREITLARPSPKKRGWGQMEDLPALDGVFSPFIDELASNDATTLLSVISTYFLGTLGANADSAKMMFHRIKSAWGVLHSTYQGRVLTHMAKCIDIAMLCQARCFPIFDGEEYVGTGIMGWGFKIAVGSEEVYMPITHDELSSQMSKFARGPAILRAIATIAFDDDTDSEMAMARWSKMTYLGQMRKELQAMKLSESDRDEILKLLARLRMPAQFWKVTPPMIVKALEHIAKSETPDDLPIHPSRMFSNDNVELVWSCFGPLAPTPFFPSAPTHDLLKRGKEPTHIIFRSLVIDEAVNDIKKILRSGKLPIAPRTQGASGPYKNRMWEKKNCSQIVGAFQAACGNVESGGIASASGGLGGIVDEGDLLVDFF